MVGNRGPQRDGVVSSHNGALQDMMRNLQRKGNKGMRGVYTQRVRDEEVDV